MLNNFRLTKLEEVILFLFERDREEQHPIIFHDCKDFCIVTKKNSISIVDYSKQKLNILFN